MALASETCAIAATFEGSTVQTRKLGRSNLQVAPLVFGGNVFGWTADEAMSFRLLDIFVDAGFNAIDTADVYAIWIPGSSGGESETVIGKWMQHRGNRERVVIATKCGMDMGGDKKGLSRRWITQAVDDSLRRLQTDYIDLFQAHADDETVPLAETLETFADLIKAGKIRTLGASNYRAERLREALAISARLGLPRYETLQPHYNLVEREKFEGALADLCTQEEIGVIPYYSLAAGFLSGKYRSEQDINKSTRGRGVKKYLNERGFKILAALDQIAEHHGASPAQVSLAWLMTKIAAPIASATNVEQLNQLMAAANLQLSADDKSLLAAASD
ncbi:MAG: aldo/keto reductase [Spongiibacteraceae bacterium]